MFRRRLTSSSPSEGRDLSGKLTGRPNAIGVSTQKEKRVNYNQRARAALRRVLVAAAPAFSEILYPTYDLVGKLLSRVESGLVGAVSGIAKKFSILDTIMNPNRHLVRISGVVFIALTTLCFTGCFQSAIRDPWSTLPHLRKITPEGTVVDRSCHILNEIILTREQRNSDNSFF